MDRVPGVILAGGLSSRMGGGDKCLLDLGGQPVLGHVITRLRPQVGALALNANGDPARFDGFDLPVLPDVVAGHPGPLAGILTAMTWAAALGASHVITAAADTPFFPRDLARRLLSSGGDMALAVTPHPRLGMARHPTFGLWPTRLCADLRAAIDDGVRKVVLWSDRYNAQNVVFDEFPCEDPFFNVNTPADLSQARDRVEGKT